MSCHQRRLDISAWIDGQLEADESRRLQEHLANCTECARFREELLACHDVFAEAGRYSLEPPGRIWARIEARLEEQAAAPALGQRIAALLSLSRYGYATALTMLVASLFFVSHRQDELARHFLAELDAYQLEVEGNPFFVQPALSLRGGNPFLTGPTKPIRQ